MKFDLAPIAAGLLPSGVVSGNYARTVSGCRAIKIGAGGLWAIDSFGSIPEDERVLTLTPGPGTNANLHVVSFGVPTNSNGSLQVEVRLDGVSTDLSFYFKLERRPRG